MKLTAANTALVLDSTADFPQAPERFPNWRVVPLYVNFGEVSYRDWVDLGPDAFYERLAESTDTPTTSQPTPGDFLAAAAAAAAALPGGTVRVIDTLTVSAATAMLGFALQRRLERGTTDEELDAVIDRYRATHGLLFTVDTLEYLARGGRIGRAAALAGALLTVKPFLTSEAGEVVPLKRVRGGQKALDELRALFAAGSSDAPSLRVGLAHAAAPDRLRALEALVAAARPSARIEISTSLGAVVGTHAGPGTLGLFWFDDPE